MASDTTFTAIHDVPLLGPELSQCHPIIKMTRRSMLQYSLLLINSLAEQRQNRYGTYYVCGGGWVDMRAGYPTYWICGWGKT